MSYEAGSITVKGVKYQVSVDEDGTWSAYVNNGNTRVTGATKEALAKAVSRETRKAVTKVAVPFVQLGGARPEGRRGVATGLHSRSGNILVRWSNGTSEQIRSWGNSGTVLTGELTDEEIKNWSRLRSEYTALSRQLFQFENEHKIDLPKAVRQALDKAVAGEEPA